jgi:hypothetical protein
MLWGSFRNRAPDFLREAIGLADEEVPAQAEAMKGAAGTLVPLLLTVIFSVIQAKINF